MKENINELMKEYGIFIQVNILPNMVAFGIAWLYFHNKQFEYDFWIYYETIKNLVNVSNINKYKVYRITKNILKTKYNLVIIKNKPLIIKEINSL